jgi:hypothetical protein
MYRELTATTLRDWATDVTNVEPAGTGSIGTLGHGATGLFVVRVRQRSSRWPSNADTNPKDREFAF